LRARSLPVSRSLNPLRCMRAVYLLVGPSLASPPLSASPCFCGHHDSVHGNPYSVLYTSSASAQEPFCLPHFRDSGVSSAFVHRRKCLTGAVVNAHTSTGIPASSLCPSFSANFAYALLTQGLGLPGLPADCLGGRSFWCPVRRPHPQCHRLCPACPPA
jgi:hypothetical protein